MNDEHIDKAYKNLANAIVLRAVNDYRFAILYNDESAVIRCERFFNSDWCAFLAGVSGKNITEKLRSETLEFKEKAFKIFDEKESQNDTEPSKKAFKCPTCRAWVDISYGFVSKQAKSKGYFATCSSCGLEVKRKNHAEPILFSKN